jgi:hypothetical protein
MHAASASVLLAVFWDAQIVRWVVWVGLVVLTVALLLLIRTRWGQSQPLGKCVVLSLIAHLLVGIYTTTVNIVTETVGSPDGKGIQVALVDSSAVGEEPAADVGGPQAWDTVTGTGPGTGFAAPLELAPRAAASALPTTSEPERPTPSMPTAAPAPIKIPSTTPSDDLGPPVLAGSNDAFARPIAKQPEPIESSTTATTEKDPVPPPDPLVGPGGDKTSPGNDALPAAPAKPIVIAAPSAVPSAGGPNDPGGSAGMGPLKPVPPALQQRVGDHLQVARGRGATQDSEARVTAALRWLAANQTEGGRWEARRLGGGAGRAADLEDRQAAGAQADSGITGLSLLAFLAAGHTHVQGPDQRTVRRGLSYLMSMQDADGCLGASNNRYERMYCHAMATCALCEAFAMTGDEWLGPSVRRAIRYTIVAQDRIGGGWRYHPGDPGDTSQLGWQVMALKSAELAGIAVPPETRDGIQRFLKSVAAGRSSGLARYQPNRGSVSRSMTAEALVCRQFMALSQTPESIEEASSFVLQDAPGASQTNVYYWYYATLGMYQVQGDAWRKWNEALQKNLMASQRTEGDLAGSWDPDPVWGGCGGRAYSTALSALCLEVYYRFLPLHIEAAGRPQRSK